MSPTSAIDSPVSAVLPVPSQPDWHWAPRFETMPGECFVTVQAIPLPEPSLIAFNSDLADNIGIPADVGGMEACADFFAGNIPLLGGVSLSAIYSGHQFGVYVPRLGDGRALNLGAWQGRDGAIWEVQLKGAGRTPFSRMGDGRAVLRSSIREYLCSEAMFGLGIPSTRALCLVGSPQPVLRENVETAAVLTRTAPSFLRFGSFEYWYYQQRIEVLEKLVNWTIDHLYPECRLRAKDKSEGYVLLLAEVVRKTAELMADWQAVGFMHGVMNTDNMSILGLTLDYGPYGFMEDFDPHHICNHSDEEGRYAYNAQPGIGLWNLQCLAETFSPFIPDVALIRETLESYIPIFETRFLGHWQNKLGLREQRAGDAVLIQGWLEVLEHTQADFTLANRALAYVSTRDSQGGNGTVRKGFFTTGIEGTDIDDPYDLFQGRERVDGWLSQYVERLRQEQSDDELRAVAMNQVNPLYVLRNHLAESAIRTASDKQDYTLFNRLYTVLRHPFTPQVGAQLYTRPLPKGTPIVCVSCSS